MEEKTNRDGDSKGQRVIDESERAENEGALAGKTTYTDVDEERYAEVRTPELLPISELLQILILEMSSDLVKCADLGVATTPVRGRPVSRR